MSTISVRRLPWDFSELPRHWLMGLPFPTHAVNGLSLVFPEGERFFIRSVRYYLDEIDDPDLKARVRAFAGQEAQHGRAHEATFRALEDQGYELASWLRWYEKVAYRRIERVAPPALRLSCTAALEHFTASLGEDALTDGFLEAHAHPVMRDLLQWHAAEEIEHKSVAFDVFERVDGRYSVRMAGLAIATATLLAFWSSATRHLLAQEPELTQEQIREQRQAMEALGKDRYQILRRALVDYLRPGFHPDDRDNYHVAEAFFARFLEPEAA